MFEEENSSVIMSNTARPRRIKKVTQTTNSMPMTMMTMILLLVAAQILLLSVTTNAWSFAKSSTDLRSVSRRGLVVGSSSLIAGSFLLPSVASSGDEEVRNLGDRRQLLKTATTSTPSMSMTASIPIGTSTKVAYRSIKLNIPNYGVQVPVACWYPLSAAISDDISVNAKVSYRHRISIRRIGELLAKWDFIPEFASKNFELSPLSDSISFVAVDSGGSDDNDETSSTSFPIPTASKVVILAHGYLGSRFDLSHYAEELAKEGFVCISPEYPESLAASYDRLPGLDRSVINNELLRYLRSKVQPKSYGIIGHSLGCGTALNTGDASWARVLIAGRAPERPTSPLLFISSVNDGTVRFSGPISISSDYTVLEEDDSLSKLTSIPSHSALIFNRPDGPNHISYLSKGVNDAMIQLLSPLLPVAQALSIPVLDFDKYQLSQDAEPTFEIVRPLIVNFMLQHMKDDPRRS